VWGGASDNTVGGATATAGNLITNNGAVGGGFGGGVFVADFVVPDLVIHSLGNQITANRIFANDGPAIDLGGDGVTNNASAPRIGPNNLQNFPIIVSKAGGKF